MGINIGGVDLLESTINTELRIGTLEKIVQHLLTRMTPGVLSQMDVDRFRDETIAEMQKKYPEAGIQSRK